MLKRLRRRHRLNPKTVGMDAGYDDGEFLSQVEKLGATPHVPIREGAIVATDAAGEARRRARRRKQTVAYRLSQRIRKRVEQIFGWCKTVGRLARTRFLGQERIELEALLTATAYNLLRISHLARTG